jgi:DNA-binding GntR family transcriptional regulator
MPKVPIQKDAIHSQENGKAPSIVAQKIREAILDEVYLPGEHLREIELAEKFEVSRSPVREALLALEKKAR